MTGSHLRRLTCEQHKGAVDCIPSKKKINNKCVRFLSQTCPASSLADLAELVLDMASVIVERSSLLPAILPGMTREKPKALSAVLSPDVSGEQPG
jgi:hypothetical protein